MSLTILKGDITKAKYKDSMELNIVLFDAEAFEIAKRKHAMLIQDYKRFFISNMRKIFWKDFFKAVIDIPFCK